MAAEYLLHLLTHPHIQVSPKSTRQNQTKKRPLFAASLSPTATMRAFAFLGLFSVALAAPTNNPVTKDAISTLTPHNNELSRQKVSWPTEQATVLDSDIFKVTFTKAEDDKYSIYWQYKGPADGGYYSGKVLSDGGEILVEWIGQSALPAGGDGIKKQGEYFNFVVESWTMS
ncbi:hypothetical protein QTJ16_006668 [Diplocarpon rosae]|uniref:Uncharacterized protein n=1 Tax=Diplocarpon rosae TaxID=946125 RepID=A0AAD9WCP9_9HELO|nr:hypothetical protein QTJ16_006668 [Diplocarpon rosae]